MNYYNPYYMMAPYGNMASSLPAMKGGMFSSLLGGVKGINWGTIISNTQRTLGIVNQAIPVIKQVTPVAKNAKTMFKVMSEFKKVDEISNSKQQTVNTNVNNSPNYPNNANTISNNNTPINTTITNNNTPTFFA